MLRKLALGLVAAGSLGLAAFVPTAASAYSDGPHFRGHHHGFACIAATMDGAARMHAAAASSSAWCRPRGARAIGP